MAVGVGAAVAGDMLDDRQHAALEEACGRAAKYARCGASGVRRIGAIADECRASTGTGTSQNRGAVDIDAQAQQFGAAIKRAA